MRSRSDAIRGPFWANFVRPGGQMNVEMSDNKLGKNTPQHNICGRPKVPEYLGLLRVLGFRSTLYPWTALSQVPEPVDGGSQVPAKDPSIRVHVPYYRGWYIPLSGDRLPQRPYSKPQASLQLSQRLLQQNSHRGCSQAGQDTLTCPHCASRLLLSDYLITVRHSLIVVT